MHHEITKALYDVYPLEDKSDFFPAYIYMKYIEHFIYHAFQSLGLPAKEPKDKLDESVDEMLKYYVQQIADTSPSFETNIYHGKVVKLKDAIKLVIQKHDLNLSLPLPLPERVLPFKVARDVVLKGNDSIAVGTCVCRSVSESPCLPPLMMFAFSLGTPLPLS